MTTTERRPARDEVPGWAGRVMVVLRFVTQLVAINLLIVAGTVAGLVVAGFVPALHAGGLLLARLVDGDASDHLWRDFWGAWSGTWRRTTLLGLPVVAAMLVLLLDAQVLRVMEGPAGAALRTGGVLVTLWVLVVTAYLPAVTRRYDEPWTPTWRFLVLTPALGPLTAVAMVVTCAVVALVLVYVPVLGPLVGLSAPLLATGLLADGRFDRLDESATTAR
ncbi:DUF624 domain-containing protein [Cellulosimicrobium terreum]|nr:DUF624 domain-containing protein [Cellulosimicrobium terreum]